MMAVSVALGSGEARHQYIGAEGSDHPHHIAERDLVTAPLGKSLVGAFGKAEVGDPREAFLDAVILVRCQQFQGAQHAEHIR